MIHYNPTTDTIMSLAHSRGSRAKTRDGAWKFLLAHLPQPVRGRAPELPWHVRRYRASAPSAREAWRVHHWRTRVERNADAILRHYGYVAADPNTPERVAMREKNLAEWARMLKNASTNVLAAQRNHADVRIGDAIYRHNWDESREYNRYSKSWHRMHGPSVTVYNRRLERLEYDDGLDGGIGGNRVVRSIPVAAFRGNYLIDAIARDLGIAPIKYPKHLRQIQLNTYFELARVRKIAGVEIYRRTFAGEPVDYCARIGEDTYHADTIAETIAGLRKKREAAADYERQLLDMSYALSLGFCRAGVEQFCADYGLDCSASYTRAELRQIVQSGNGRAAKYRPELKKAGIL